MPCALSQKLWITGERECATGSPMIPASPNPSACDILRFHLRPHPARATCADAGCFLLNPPFGARPFYLVVCPSLLGGMAIVRNANLAPGKGLNGGRRDAITVARVVRSPLLTSRLFRRQCSNRAPRD